MKLKRGDWVTANQSRVWAWSDHILDWYASDDFGFIIEEAQQYIGMDNMVKILNIEKRREVWVDERDLMLISARKDKNGS